MPVVRKGRGYYLVSEEDVLPCISICRNKGEDCVRECLGVDEYG